MPEHPRRRPRFNLSDTLDSNQTNCRPGILCLLWSCCLPWNLTPIAAQDSAVTTRRIEPHDRPRATLRSERNLVFAQADGTDLRADLYRPDTQERLPWVLMIHGGAWMTGDKWNLSDHARQVALAGFAVMNINYRLAPKAHYPAQLEDCQAALHWMKQHEEDWLADNRRVGVWGYSAGAQLAALLTLRPQACPMDVDACVVGGTPCDLTQVPEQSQILVPVFGATRRDNPDIYREASPIHYASTHAPPMFFFHGTRDFIVPIFSSQRMHERLKELGATTEYLSIEGQGHLVTFVHPSATRAGIDFLVKHLKDR